MISKMTKNATWLHDLYAPGGVDRFCDAFLAVELSTRHPFFF